VCADERLCLVCRVSCVVCRVCADERRQVSCADERLCLVCRVSYVVCRVSCVWRRETLFVMSCVVRRMSCVCRRETTGILCRRETLFGMSCVCRRETTGISLSRLCSPLCLPLVRVQAPLQRRRKALVLARLALVLARLPRQSLLSLISCVWRRETTGMACRRSLGSLTSKVSFSKEPYRRDYILQKRRMI